jgi:hypothetical protein
VARGVEGDADLLEAKPPTVRDEACGDQHQAALQHAATPFVFDLHAHAVLQLIHGQRARVGQDLSATPEQVLLRHLDQVRIDAG